MTIDVKEELQALREEFGLSLTELGRRLPADRVTINRWEKGRQRPPPYLWRAVRHLRCELQDEANMTANMRGAED